MNYEIIGIRIRNFKGKTNCEWRSYIRLACECGFESLVRYLLWIIINNVKICKFLHTYIYRERERAHMILITCYVLLNVDSKESLNIFEIMNIFN